MITVGVIPAFKGIGSPITADGMIDYRSRYIQADIRIALAYIVELARKVGVPTRTADGVLNNFIMESMIYREISGSVNHELHEFCGGVDGRVEVERGRRS